MLWWVSTLTVTASLTLHNASARYVPCGSARSLTEPGNGMKTTQIQPCPVLSLLTQADAREGW